MQEANSRPMGSNQFRMMLRSGSISDESLGAAFREINDNASAITPQGMDVIQRASVIEAKKSIK